MGIISSARSQKPMRSSLAPKRKDGVVVRRNARRALGYAVVAVVVWLGLFRPLASKRGAAGPAAQRLLVVIPFTPNDVDSIHTNLQLWHDLGPICSRAAAASADIWFYFNRNESILSSTFRALQCTAEYRELGHCFRRQDVVSANLTDEEDDYPRGISIMFFRLATRLLYAAEQAPYAAMYWMEPDVIPVKPLWLDALVNEVRRDTTFWIKGSAYLGDALDVDSGWDRDWVGHINGNALYRLNDGDFIRFLNIVAEREPPSHYWKPFDVSIWKVLHDFPYSWHMFQRIANRFVYSDYVQHWSFQLTPDDLSRSKESPRTFLVHGKPGSAGSNQFRSKFVGQKSKLAKINWDGSVERSDDVCVLIRSHARELQYARLAVSSVLKHMPGVVEIAAAVPDVDVTLFQRRFAHVLTETTATAPGAPRPAVRFLPEERLHPDEFDDEDDDSGSSLQDAYTRALADRYCARGRYIFQLRADTVLVRKLYRKDFFFEGKPLIRYDRYSNRPNAALLWQRGTAFALGFSIEHAFAHGSDHLVPRAALTQARAHVEKRHGVSFRDFMRTRVGSIYCMEGQCPKNDPAAGFSEDQVRSLAFSYSAYIGAYIHAMMASAVSWIPAEPAMYHSQAFVPVVPAFTCQGNPWLARSVGMEEVDLRALKEAVSLGGCVECRAWQAEWARKYIQRLERPRRGKHAQ